MKKNSCCLRYTHTQSQICNSCIHIYKYTLKYNNNIQYKNTEIQGTQSIRRANVNITQPHVYAHHAHTHTLTHTHVINQTVITRGLGCPIHQETQCKHTNNKFILMVVLVQEEINHLICVNNTNKQVASNEGAGAICETHHLDILSLTFVEKKCSGT